MVKKIPVSNGKAFALVDDEDFEYLSQRRWRLMRGYAVRNMKHYRENGIKKRKHISMHRELNKTPDGKFTDHINRNKMDNRKCNLRTVTKQQNQWNKASSRKSPSSKYKGVSYLKGINNKKWRSCIKINGKTLVIGAFDREEDAAQAYNFVANAYHGEYAYLNKSERISQ